MFELGIYVVPVGCRDDARPRYSRTVLAEQHRGAEVIEFRRHACAVHQTQPSVPRPPRRVARTVTRWLWSRWLAWTPVCRFRDWREWRRVIKHGEPINWPDRLRTAVKK